MADHYWATLNIGGRVTAEQLREIVQLAVQDGAEQMECPAGLRLLLPEQRGLEVIARPQQTVLAVTGEVNWGAFETLEAYLRWVRIPYDRETEAAPGEPTILVRFRPGRGAVIHPSDGKGHPVLTLKVLEQAVAETATREELIHRIRQLAGADIPPLPPLQVQPVAATACSA